MATASLKLLGEKELFFRLFRLDDRIRNSITQKALRASTKPFLQEVKSNAPVRRPSKYPSKTQLRPRALKRSLAYKGKKYRRGAVNVGIVGSYYSGARRAPHAHLVDKGTGQRYRFNPKIFGKPYARDISEKAALVVKGTSGQKRTEARKQFQKGFIGLLGDRESRSTGRMPPSLFFTNAWRKHRPRIYRRLGVELWKGIRANAR